MDFFQGFSKVNAFNLKVKYTYKFEDTITLHPSN